MYILYNLFIGFMYLGAFIAAPFNAKARKFVNGRNGVLKYLKANMNANEKIIWLHAASLGEFEQGRPVIEAMQKKYPQHKVLLTFFSPSGFEVRKNYKGVDYICYLPLDFSWHARRFVQLVKPSAVFFVKYEFWFNFLREVHKNNIPLYGVSIILRENQAYFQWWGAALRKVLHFFTTFYVQNDESLRLLNSIGLKNVRITGDTRFDRVAEIAAAARPLPIVEAFVHRHRAFVAGSTWPADENLLVQLINEGNTGCRFIIAPHEIHESGIARLQELIKVPSIRYSVADKAANLSDYQVLIIDNIGILSSVYRYGILGYIGGGFGKGIHNILEAATFGLPIIFGPNYTKFKEAVDLVIKNGAYCIETYHELHDTVKLLLENESALMLAHKACKDYVAANTGGTAIIVENSFLKE